MQREHEETEGMKYVKMDNRSIKFPDACDRTAAYTPHTTIKAGNLWCEHQQSDFNSLPTITSPYTPSLARMRCVRVTVGRFGAWHLVAWRLWTGAAWQPAAPAAGWAHVMQCLRRLVMVDGVAYCSGEVELESGRKEGVPSEPKLNDQATNWSIK